MCGAQRERTIKYLAEQFADTLDRDLAMDYAVGGIKGYKDYTDAELADEAACGEELLLAQIVDCRCAQCRATIEMALVTLRGAVA